MVFIVASINKNVTSVLSVGVKIFPYFYFKMWEIQRHMTPI